MFTFFGAALRWPPPRARMLQLYADTRHVNRTRLHGFTLVELLAVITIIGTFIGLLLPAVQQIRESARKTHCGNNLRQIALGVSGYESGHRGFPVGCDIMPQDESLPGGTEHAWSSFILAYIEQRSLADRINLRERWDAPGGNDGASDTLVPEYVCPSGIVASIGKADYGGVSGSWIIEQGVPNFGPSGLCNGMLFSVDESRQPVREATVSDGMSTTLLVAESVDAGDPTESADDPNATGRWARLNCFVQAGSFINTRGSDISGKHPGGAQTAFADARVVFLSDTMDPFVLSAVCTRNGGESIASRYGP